MAGKTKDSSTMTLKSGVDWSLEEQADAILSKDRGDARSSDYLSQDQLDLRARREISNQLGVADAALMRGMYRRAHNPLAGTRPTKLGRSHDDG
ncbi:hypothetical protein SEA_PHRAPPUCCINO_131 [Mycobacterium phage Phrappuccino]|uniref:Uncharacterized protein n=1 Tax=Mycobacterium phage Phrappuccino TaxID=2591223 RepID=A0A514DDX2_9CAUD|nr:hypothetical protein KHQ87_gp131 [Mycobacterium phage Phrappuccino]QDH91806.1 hypothetical protein SEA_PHRAPPUCCINO_131 [Mycobacterium phage Phrappuccino]QIQ63248.1 hypothetical protein SEA_SETTECANDELA_131 [Mycobacterium phage Settecandela]